MFEEDLRNALLGSAGLSALVARRIHWDLPPQGAALPNLVLTLVASPGEYVYGGRAGLTGHRVQADAYGATKADVKAVARAFRDAIETLPPPFKGGFLITENSGLDAGAGRAVDQAADPLHRASLDVRVWHAD